MQNDILSKHPHTFLGSRLKRLADRFATDAAKINRNSGFQLFPSQVTLLAQIDENGTISVMQLAQIMQQSQPAITRNLNTLCKLNLVINQVSDKDQRLRMVSLTKDGQELMAQMRNKIWGRVDSIIHELLLNSAPEFIENLEKIEAELDRLGFDERFKQLVDTQSKVSPQDIEIIDYKDEYADDFYRINANWIVENFYLEDIDKHILSNPRATILDNGGHILLARVKGIGIVGTAALIMGEDGEYELAKVGVDRNYRGLKIGEKVIIAAQSKAKDLGIKSLFLLTNHLQQASIHLYEKLGFEHSEAILIKYGHEFERADVAMFWRW